ncbi:PI-PLC X domain-containing protein 2-like [Ciona intestinalis]
MDWMNKLPDDLKDSSLFSLAIPGSHDSCAFYLNEYGPLDPRRGGLLNWFKSIVKNWGITQRLGVTDQLNIGVRYFDLRVAPNLQTDELHIVHGLLGLKVSDILCEMNKFLNNHPSEVIIVHFLDLLEFEKTHHDTLMGIISTAFSGKLCPSGNHQNLTLNNMISNSYQVIVIYPDKLGEWIWPSRCIDSKWLNTKNEDEAIRLLEQNLAERMSNVSTFHVAQAVITPDNLSIGWNLTGTLLTWVADFNVKVMNWLDSKPAVNIIIIDDCNTEFAKKVIALNY